MPLIKLKTKFQYSIIIILALTLLIRIKTPIKPIYKGNTKKISGVITECKNKEDKTIIAVKAKEKILINFYENYPCTIGKKITATGNLKTPNSNTNFNLFNYKKYLLSKNIIHTFNAHKIKENKSTIKIHYKIKNNIIKYIEKYKSKRYLNALILGDESQIEKDIKESYQANGITHLFAISGAQIILLSSIVYKTTNYFLENKKTSYFITLIILLFYLFLTNSPPSILRSTLTIILSTFSKELNLKIKSHIIIIIVALLLLNINPYYIYSLGFKLSFVVSFYLALFKKIINRQKNYIMKNIIISSIAFIASYPLIINTFFHINLLSPIINIAFIPFISFIIYPASIIALVFKPLDIPLYNLTKVMENMSKQTEKISFLDVTLKKIPPTYIIIYYIIITLLLLIYQKKLKNFFPILLLLLIIHKNINLIEQDTVITALNVNQGDSILIRKDNQTTLIDTGGDTINKENHIGKQIIIPYLMSEGISRINTMIISHGDYDHMGEAITIINNFKVDKVVFNCGPYNDLEKKLIKTLNKKNIKYYSCIKELNVNNNKLQFLQTKVFDNENDNSNVIYTKINGYKFLFMGDAGAEVEKEILKKYNLQDIDVLKVGHHGSKTSSSKEFINEIKPKNSIISVGKNNRYGHPNKEVLNNLQDSKIYRTDQDGSIIFKLKSNKLEIKTYGP